MRNRTISSFRHVGWAATAALAGLALLPAAAQGTNPWTPPGAQPTPVYAGDAAGGVPGSAWTVPQPGSQYAPLDLEAQLSGAAPVAQAAPMMPQVPAPTTTPPVMPLAVPPVGVPGVVTPVVPGVAAYPGAMPYGSGMATGVAPAIPGYGWGVPGTALPYGYSPGYGAGWPGYAPGWGGGGWPGTGLGGWPGTGFSPFGFW